MLSSFARAFISQQISLHLTDIHCYYTLHVGLCLYFLTLSYNTWKDSNHKWNGHTVYTKLANSHKSATKTGKFCISFSTLFSHEQTLQLHGGKRQTSKLNLHTARNICTKVRTFGNCKVSASQRIVNITSTSDAVYTPATRTLD
jgi:hypothetical protein